MRQVGVAVVLLVIDECVGFWGEPAAGLGIHVAKGLLGVEHGAVVVEDVLEGVVDFLAGEEGPSVGGLHELNEDAVEGEPHQLAVAELGAQLHRRVHYIHHLPPRVPLQSAPRLLYPRLPVQPQQRLRVNQFFEVCDGGQPVLGYLGKFLGVFAEGDEVEDDLPGHSRQPSLRDLEAGQVLRESVG